MISEKDVIRMKIPYPNISEKLAVQSHMYICGCGNHPYYEFIKCQTLKPYMIGNSTFKHYVDEKSDITRNPFASASRIDCDKLFVTATVQYHDRMKTTTRPDVCQELYDTVKQELEADGYKTIPLNEDELVVLNYLVRKI